MIRYVRNVLDAAEPKGPCRLVKIALAERANESGTCWPAMATIARDAAISVRQAKRLIRQLEEAGHVKIEYGNGLKHPNKYRLLFPLNGVMDDTVSDKQTVTYPVETVTSKAANGVIGDTENGVMDDTQTVREPKKNQREPEANLSLDIAVSMFEAEFPNKPVRRSLSRMSVDFRRALTPAACRAWLEREKETVSPRKNRQYDNAWGNEGSSGADLAKLQREKATLPPNWWSDYLEANPGKESDWSKLSVEEMAKATEWNKGYASAEWDRLIAESGLRRPKRYPGEFL